VAVTILIWFLALPGLAPIAKDNRHAKTWIAVVATAGIAYSVLSALVLMPRFVFVPLRNTKSPSHLAAMRWVVASTPFLVTFIAVIAGAKQWVTGVGFIAGIALTIAAARQIANDGRDGN
jgi:hypothetical protein